MKLECLKCDRLITPGEMMIAVVVGSPEQWTHVVKSLDITPGRWHYRCAPEHVKTYAPPVAGGGRRRRVEDHHLSQWLAAGISMLIPNLNSWS